MTLASAIITDAYRETNLIPMGVAPNANQLAEALTRLNVILHSTLGNEVGDEVDEINIGGNNNQDALVSTYIPDNTKLMLNLGSAKTFLLDPFPFNGQRAGVVDVKGNLATFNVVIDGNGRLVEGTPTITMNTNSDIRQWMYRSDIGQWVKYTTLLSTDALPFPTRFDDYFVTMLAMRLNPRYGQQLTGETLQALKRSRNQIRSHYHAYKQIRSDLNTRGFMNDQDGVTSLSDSEFKTGRIGW